MAGLYIHIPFCKQACHYCDFYFSTSQGNREKVIQAIGTEIGLQKDYLSGEEIQTIYLGGGTPSILSNGELYSILDAIHRSFSVSATVEVTLEANPDDLTPPKLGDFRSAGVNRLSIGIQSFDDVILKSLNRAHDAQMAKSCVQLAREAGFDNISVDLIYAIPEQTDKDWKRNIEQVLQLQPEHISSYSLTIEEKTVFGKWAKQGKMKAVDDDVAAAQLSTLVDILEKKQYEQYEVSNFSKPGFQSAHNSNYWKNKKYLGIGPSAHSYNGVSRQSNIGNNHLYLQSILQNKIPFTIEVLRREDKINEYLLTTLRTSWGTDLNVLRQQFSYDLLIEHKDYIQSLLVRKFATLENDVLRLTKAGRLLADKIASDLFVISPDQD